ncbi:hypothetical protein EMCRGX_G026807 [Ephydatia muelleri]
MEDVNDPLEIDRDLICFVCNLEFKDPRFLPCHHYYCAKCIDQLASFAKPFVCPQCGVETTLPEGSRADTLPEALVVRKIKKHVEAVKVLEGVDLEDHVAPSYVFTCRDHDIQQRLYCYDCNRLVCSECTLVTHRGHSYEFVREAAPKFRRDMEVDRAAMASTIETVQTTGDQLNQRKHEMLEQAQQAKVKLHQSFDEMQRILDARREALVQAVDELTEYHVTVLNDKVAATRASAETLHQLLGLVGKLAAASDEEFASSYCHIRSLLRAKQENTVVFNVEPGGVIVDITCVEDIRRLTQTGAKVLCPSLLAQNLGIVEFGKTTPIVVHHVALVGNRPTAIKANLISLTDQVMMPAKAMRRRNGTGYEIMCNPRTRGRHQLAIEVAGNPIDGSPFPIFVTMPFAMLGKPVRAMKALMRPTTVAFDRAGHVIVSEREINRVSVRDKKGLKLTEFRGHTFMHPWGVAMDNEDCVYVSEYLAHRVTKFDSNGKFLKVAGKQGSGNLEFYYPKGIHCIQNKLYICDGKNDRIQVLDKELQFLEMLNHNIIKSPIDIAASPSDGCLFVVSSTPGVHVFNLADHTYLYSVEHKGVTHLSGVCYSPVQSALYVCDVSPAGPDVHVFQCDGRHGNTCTYIGSVNRKGGGSGSLGTPTGIGLDEDCYVYVCDSEQDRILVF